MSGSAGKSGEISGEIISQLLSNGDNNSPFLFKVAAHRFKMGTRGTMFCWGFISAESLATVSLEPDSNVSLATISASCSVTKITGHDWLLGVILSVSIAIGSNVSMFSKSKRLLLNFSASDLIGMGVGL